MSNTSSSNSESKGRQKTETNTYDLDICMSDPGWAEHARPNDTGPDPCDDGRGFQFEKGDTL